MNHGTPDSTRRFCRRTVRVRVDYCAEDGVHCEYATTLGADGLFVETEKPPPPDSRLEIRFRLADGLSLHQIAGRVVWIRGQERNGRERCPGMAVQFIDSKGCSALARDLERLDQNQDAFPR